MAVRTMTVLVGLGCFALGSWFGDDVVEELFQKPPASVEVDVIGRDALLQSKIAPKMQEVYAVLEPTPEKYAKSKAHFMAVPHKDRIECQISVPPSKEIIARVNVWNDGRVEGGWE